MKLAILAIIIIILFFFSYSIVENFDLKFVHIPKNAGTSIENVALKHNIKWGFRDWSKKKDNKLLENSWDAYKAKGPWINRSTNKLNNRGSCNPWHKTPDDLGRDYYKTDDDLFCVVRNPYDKIVSAYKYKFRNGSSKEGLNKFIKEMLTDFSSNERWNGCHILPQHKYTHGNIKCDNILKFESLDSDFKKLLSKYNINLNIELEKNNKSKANVSVNDLTQESKDLIYKVYKKDFELFNYKK